MVLKILQYLGIVLALGLLGDCTAQSGDFDTSIEDILDSNYDVSDQTDNESKEDAGDISNGIQEQNLDVEKDHLENNDAQNSDQRVKENVNLENRSQDSNNYLNELQKQIIDAHTKHRPEIKYKVVKQFGGNEGNEKFVNEDEVDLKTVKIAEGDTDEKHQEIDYETINKFNPSHQKQESAANEHIEGNDFINGNKETEHEESMEEGKDDSSTEKEVIQSTSQEEEVVTHNKTKQINSKMQQKGKKNVDTHLLESHLEEQTRTNNSMQQLLHSESYLPVKILQHLEDYEEQEVEPLHLACTATTIFDTFPVKADMNFSQHFGLESESFITLQSYLLGHNVEGRKIALNFPVFLTVTPLLNNTVERAICVWLSNFSSLIPPEMDRHLGFLEIPQPLNPKIEIYASGQKIKYARTFVGFANDWIYRKEVKKLLDSIIENGDGEMMDFRSYCIDIEGGNKHTVSFVKKI